MAADPNQNKAKIDTSQLKFNVNDNKTKLIATYNDEEAAFIEFTITDKVLNISRTVTIEKYRGNGIASKITKEMFEYGKKEKYTISSDCWYTPKFLGKKENEDYNKIYKDKAKI